MILNKSKCGHTENLAHDCKYVDERNSLIPRAAEIANKEFPTTEHMWASHDLYSIWATRWDRVFLETMDKLWREKKANEELLRIKYNGTS